MHMLHALKLPLEEPLHARCQRRARAPVLAHEYQAWDQVHALAKAELQRRLSYQRRCC